MSSACAGSVQRVGSAHGRQVAVDKKPRIFAMAFARVYPLYVQKGEKKGRTKDEVDEVVTWLTGYRRPRG